MSNQTKDRILQFIGNKGISVREFCRRCGFSHAIFTTPSSLGSDKLAKIFDNFPDFNIHWVVTGKEHFSTVEKEVTPASDLEKKYVELLEKHTQLQAEFAEILKNQSYQEPHRKAGNGA